MERLNMPPLILRKLSVWSLIHCFNGSRDSSLTTKRRFVLEVGFIVDQRKEMLVLREGIVERMTEGSRFDECAVIAASFDGIKDVEGDRVLAKD